MLPPDFVISHTLKVGVVYRMVVPELIKTSKPHFFVVVAIDGDSNFLVLSTTRLQKKISHVQKIREHLDTIAYITPNDTNGLTSDSYFNCNEYYSLSKTDLVKKVEEGKLKPVGDFNETEYKKLCKSILLSEKNDIPKFLLKFG